RAALAQLERRAPAPLVAEAAEPRERLELERRRAHGELRLRSPEPALHVQHLLARVDVDAARLEPALRRDLRAPEAQRERHLAPAAARAALEQPVIGLGLGAEVERERRAVDVGAAAQVVSPAARRQ